MHLFSGGPLDPRGPHFFASGIALLWIGSAAISALPAPCGGSRPAYQWLYRFLHLLAANVDHAGLLPALPVNELGNPRSTKS